ncbi:MAG: hypothetical protein QOJ07_1085, partial [Thermoleophilaceae bacterium]|nr:hypothetical protein [Thermoleophilaceae bacterium]
MTPLSRRGLIALRATQVLALAAVVAYAVQGALADPDGALSALFENWVYPGLILLAALGCLARAVRAREDRWAWALLAAGLLSWTAGEAWYSLFLADLDSPPLPSIADALWLGFYPAAYAALVLLARGRGERLHRSLWLDGVIGAFATASVGAALVFGAIVASGEGDASLIGVDLTYLLGDFALIGFTVAVFALTGWRPGAVWGLLGAGLIVSAIVDGFFMWEDATGHTLGGTAPAALWPAAALLIAAAAWQRPAAAPARPRGAGIAGPTGARIVAMPLTFATAALAVLVANAFQPVNALALGLAVATLSLVIVRLALTFRENIALLASSREEAATDALTGLGNRRKLMADLAVAAAAATPDEPIALMLFDLDGFKRYNDVFGHPAGDALLAKLGGNLDFAVGARGDVYRLGGDEFCAIVDTDAEGAREVRAEALAALAERGQSFEVGSSCGIALIPLDAVDPDVALKLADHRLYD